LLLSSDPAGIIGLSSAKVLGERPSAALEFWVARGDMLGGRPTTTSNKCKNKRHSLLTIENGRGTLRLKEI
jgi:hypothetical protein